MKRIWLPFTFYLLLLTLVVSCGRRGEPVPIVPAEDILKTETFQSEGVKEGRGSEVETPSAPEPPTGLIAAYTKIGVVLTWDEIHDKGVKAYNVYRSSDGSFELIGESITPAFTDRSVEPDRRYLYRVTALTDMAESPPSQEIEVFTGSR